MLISLVIKKKKKLILRLISYRSLYGFFLCVIKTLVSLKGYLFKLNLNLVIK